MRRMLGVAVAAAMALSVSAASAEDITGTVSNIDLTRATFMVDGKTYVASPTNTVGTKLEDLQEGDTVKPGGGVSVTDVPGIATRSCAPACEDGVPATAAAAASAIASKKARTRPRVSTGGEAMPPL